jgi:hypothetical protein
VHYLLDDRLPPAAAPVFVTAKTEVNAATVVKVQSAGEGRCKLIFQDGLQLPIQRSAEEVLEILNQARAEIDMDAVDE